jgi:hypothetical protein
MTDDLLDSALALHARGFALLPVPLKQKRPVTQGWQDLRLDQTALRTTFAVPSNVGVLLGEASGGLVDIDLDCPEARAVARYLLPSTGLISGHESAPESHWFFRVRSPLKTMQYIDPLGANGESRAMLVERRATGAQTLIPPSIHPSGEAIVWSRDGDPAEVAPPDLEQAVARLAAATLLARYWPAPGSRHAAALALGGGLLRAGWLVDETAEYVGHIAMAAGDDEADDRRQAVHSTAEALGDGEHATGWPTLATLVDPRVVDAIRRWLGITSTTETNSYEFVEMHGAELPSGLAAEQRARAIHVPPFPLEIFPPLVARYLADGAETVGCPVDLIAVPFLSYAAAALGRQRRLAIKRRWIRKATLWTGVVATSGSGKSPADGYARAPLDILQTDADERYAEQFTAYKRELAQWKAADPATRGDEPSPPLYAHWYTTDPTVESLAPMLQVNPGVAASFDELVAWARGCNAYKKGGNDRQKYLEIWNGRPLKVDRRTQGVLFVPDPVCCLVGGIQPERLPELTREASVHDGLLPRFLWTYPDIPPRAWSWDERESDDLDEVVALFEQLRSSPPLTLRLHPAARVSWATWHDAGRRQHPHLAPLARELASKLPPHLATCWLVLQALHDPEGTLDTALPEHLDAAITLIAYFQAHARRVLAHFGTDAPHVETGLAGRVSMILRTADAWMSQTELWQALGRNGRAADLHAALDALLAEVRVETRTEGDGPRRRTLWRWVTRIEDVDAPIEDAGFASMFPDIRSDVLDSYELTNQPFPELGTDSFDSYESSSSAGSREAAPGGAAGDAAGGILAPRPTVLRPGHVDPESTAGEREPDTCCLCGAPLAPDQRYKCAACTAEGVARNAARFGEEPAS